MNREEFLQGLGAALNGEVPSSVIQENLRYYDEYIRSEVSKGRPEEEVIEEIGGYRLIAKTIIEANGGDGQGAGGYRETDSNPYGNQYSGSGQDSYGGYDQRENRRGFHMYDLSRGWRRFIVPVVLVLILFLVISIIGGIFSLLSPILGPLLIIWFLVTIFRNRDQ